MAYRLSMVPRIAQRFGVHTRPHVMGLCAHLSRNIGIFCLVVAAGMLLTGPRAHLTLPVDPADTGLLAESADGLVTSPTPPVGSTVYAAEPNALGVTAMSFRATHLEGAVVAAAGWLTWASIGLALLWLAPLLRRFAAGDPFAAGNASRLRGIAGAAFVVTHVVPLLTPLTAALALHRLGASGWTPDWGFPVHSSLVFVLLLFLLAGALDVGRRLQVDSEGLV